MSTPGRGTNTTTLRNTGTPQQNSAFTLLTNEQSELVNNYRTTNPWGSGKTMQRRCTEPTCLFTIPAFQAFCDAGHSGDVDKIPHLATIMSLMAYPDFDLKKLVNMCAKRSPQVIAGKRITAEQCAHLLLHMQVHPHASILITKVRDLVDCDDLSDSQERDITKKMKKWCLSCLKSTKCPDLLGEVTDHRTEQNRLILKILASTPLREIESEAEDEEEMCSDRFVTVQGSMGMGVFVTTQIDEGTGGEICIPEIEYNSSRKESLYAQAIGIWLHDGIVKIGERRNKAGTKTKKRFVDAHEKCLDSARAAIRAADYKAKRKAEKEEKKRKKRVKKAAKKAAAKKHKTSKGKSLQEALVGPRKVF